MKLCHGVLAGSTARGWSYPDGVQPWTGCYWSELSVKVINGVPELILNSGELVPNLSKILLET